MTVSPVETRRLWLRLPEDEDAAPFLEIHQDPEAVAQKQVVMLAPPGGIDVALRNIERMRVHWEQRGYGQWALVEKGTADVVGCVGFHYAEGWPGIDLSWIIHRSRRGNGFAKESCLAAIAWLWQSTGIDHVVSLIAPENDPSIRIAIGIGEQFERADLHPISGERIHIYGIHRPPRP